VLNYLVSYTKVCLWRKLWILLEAVVAYYKVLKN